MHWFVTSWSYGRVYFHDDVINWKHFLRYWPFGRGIRRSPVNSPHKGQWRIALMFSLICAWTNGWVNIRDAGDLRCHLPHYVVTATFMTITTFKYQCDGRKRPDGRRPSTRPPFQYTDVLICRNRDSGKISSRPYIVTMNNKTTEILYWINMSFSKLAAKIYSFQWVQAICV